jgi:hypothetical protein
MNRAVFNYENAKNEIEIEIFGLEFKITVTEEILEQIQKIKVENITEENASEIIKDGIDILLGAESYNQIKDQFKKDQKTEISLFTWLKILNFLSEEVERFFEENKTVSYKNNYNRNYRRNYNKRNKNNYRRY